jgi:hypothetical protein
MVLCAGLNWYRANFNIRNYASLKPAKMPQLGIPVMGIWGSLDGACLEGQMKGSERCAHVNSALQGLFFPCWVFVSYCGKLRRQIWGSGSLRGACLEDQMRGSDMYAHVYSAHCDSVLLMLGHSMRLWVAEESCPGLFGSQLLSTPQRHGMTQHYKHRVPGSGSLNRACLEGQMRGSEMYARVYSALCGCGFSSKGRG